MNLTQTGLNLSEGFKVSVDNNSRLISLLEEQKSTTGLIGRGNSAIWESVLMKALEKLAEVGAGKRWNTKEDGLVELNKIVFEVLKEEKSRDKHYDVGK